MPHDPGVKETFMMAELERVVLTTDLPEHRLKRGDVGTVVFAHGDRGYEVEVTTLDGETVCVISVTSEQVRGVARGEITHARPVWAA